MVDWRAWPMVGKVVQDTRQASRSGTGMRRTLEFGFWLAKYGKNIKVMGGL